MQKTLTQMKTILAELLISTNQFPQVKCLVGCFFIEVPRTIARNNHTIFVNLLLIVSFCRLQIFSSLRLCIIPIFV